MRDHPGEALLVDPGSPENLCGDEWSDRVDYETAAAGRPTSTYKPLHNPLEVGGVGTGSQTATHAVTHNIVLANGKEATYTAPQLPKSGTRALLGQKSSKRMRAIIDCYNGKMYTMGPGGYKLQLSPGSDMHELEAPYVVLHSLQRKQVTNRCPGGDVDFFDDRIFLHDGISAVAMLSLTNTAGSPS